MLSYETAAQLFEEIRQKALQRTDEAFRGHYSRLLEEAAEYAKTRLAWSFMTPEERREDRDLFLLYRQLHKQLS